MCVRDNDTSGNQAGILVNVQTVGAHVMGNTSNNNVAVAGGTQLSNGVGILLDAQTAGNVVNLNTAMGNQGFDLVDNSGAGAGSCGTQNIWVCNTCTAPGCTTCDNLDGCLCMSQSAEAGEGQVAPPSEAPAVMLP